MTISIPWPLRSDAYTISGEGFTSQDAKQKSVYYLSNRYSPADVHALKKIAFSHSMILYGISDFINLLREKVTHEQIDEAAWFMKTAHSFGGPLYFPENTWRRIVNEFGGYLPITIIGLREGDAFLPNEPYIQVFSEDIDFGEIAAFVEPILTGMVSCATARATIARHWLHTIECDLMYNKGITREEARQIAQFCIHDFGFRASSLLEEANLFGRAHLLSFNGTDTFSAAYQARKLGATPPIGTSILALAHRIVQGHITEDEAFEAIRNSAAPQNIASYVADCYSFKNALKSLVEFAKKHPTDTFVARPDSGDPIENVKKVKEARHQDNLLNLRILLGDSINPEKYDEVLEAYNDFFDMGIFGVGGFLRNTSTRDLFSSAYKLMAVGSHFKPVCKIPEGTTGKYSIPGLVSVDTRKLKSVNRVYTLTEALNDSDKYMVHYTHSKSYSKFSAHDNFMVVRERAYKTFLDRIDAPNNVLGKQVIELQTAIKEQHGKVQ